MKKIIFLSSIGPKIGIGHYKRSKIASNALRKKNYLIDFFALVNSSVNKNLFFASKFFLFEKISSEFITFIKNNHFDAICFDLSKHHINIDIKNILSYLKTVNIKIISIDPIPGLERYIDLLYVPSFLKPKITKQNIPGRMVYGWDCYLLGIKKKNYFFRYINTYWRF